MPWYKNEKPSVLGLSHEAGKSARLIQPGEVFEAQKSEIPESYFSAGFVKESDAPKKGEAPPPGSGMTTGPEPVQRSETSMDKSVTDADAAASKAYVPGTSPADRSALRDKDASEPPSDDKSKKHR